MKVHLENNVLIIEDETEFYKEIINSVNGSIHLMKIDENGSTLPVWMNSQYSRITGYSFEDRQKIGFNYKDDELYHPDDIGIIRDGIKKILKDRTEGYAGMFRIKSKEGRWKWVLSSARVLTINGDPGFLLNLMVDVTEDMTKFHILTERYTKEIKQLKNEIIINKLTKTEKEIIKELVSGKSTKQIAEQRSRSYETINNHKRNIFKKLGINKISELVTFAIESGLN